MTVFKSHYKQKLRSLDREENKLITNLKRYHPQCASMILEKLEERSVRINELNNNRRLRKYFRDGISPVERTQTVGEAVSDLAQERCKPINLTDAPVNKNLVKLCSYGPTFVPIPTRIDWNEIQQAWLAFKKKIRWRAFFHSKQPITREFNNLDPPFQKSTKDPPTASIPTIEVFLDRVENDLFRQTVYKSIDDNLKPDERKALVEFRSKSIDERDIIIRMQDKGNNFVILDKNLDQEKVIEQMERGSFNIIDKDPSLDTIKVIDEWVEKWKDFGLSDKWVKFITGATEVHPGINYPLIKTHKANNPARVITSGCGTPTEKLSLFVETYCKVAVDSIECRVKDTAHMLKIVDELNDVGILESDLLVSFDIVNMFPSIDNKIGVEQVRKKLVQFSEKFDVPVDCIIEALEICLYKNCSTYQGQYWLQTDGTAMGPKNSCSYADIVAECVDLRVLEAKINFPELRSWFRFRDDTFVLWRGTVERLNNFFTFSSNNFLTLIRWLHRCTVNLPMPVYI